MEGPKDGFVKFNVKGFSFADLSQLVVFEDVCKGRKGAILVDSIAQEDGCVRVPIFRSTTQYKHASQVVPMLYRDLFHHISNVHGHGAVFNNAMVEMSETSYRKMSFHTDQSQDMEDDSFICLFSCYQRPPVEGKDMRMLRVCKKGDDNDGEECIVLDEGSCVVFSSRCNYSHVHKIVLEGNQINSKHNDNVWLGVTMRCSKTWININNDNNDDNVVVAMMDDGCELKMATHEQRRQIYASKSKENETNGKYHYPDELKHVTLSESDRMKPKTE